MSPSPIDCLLRAGAIDVAPAVRDYTRVAIVPSEAVPGRMGRPGQKRPKISFLANNSGHRGCKLEPLCRMMLFCNADIFIMH